MGSKIQTAGEIINSVSDLTIQSLLPNIIDNNIVTIFEGHHTLFLAPTTNGQMLKLWYNGRGGIFSKDVLNYTLNKPCGKYLLISNDTEDKVIRLIDEEEEIRFTSLNLIDGKIKDRPYMVLKSVNKGEELISTKRRYINEIDMALEEDECIPASNKATQDDDIEPHLGSISLFPE